MTTALGLDVQDGPTAAWTRRPRSSATTSWPTCWQDPALGETRKEREKAAQVRRADHPRPPSTCASSRPPTASVDAHVDPQDAAVGGLAMVEPGTGEVRALAQSRPMGCDTQARARPSSTTRSPRSSAARRLPARVDVQGVRARRGAGRRASRSTRRSSRPTQVAIPESEFADCGGKPYGGSDPWDPANATTSGTFKTSTRGTRESVNTFYAQLEASHRDLRALPAGQVAGRPADPPAATSTATRAECPVVHPRRRRRVSPLEMAEAYATFAARGLHCPSRPGDPHRRLRRQAWSRTTSPTASRCSTPASPTRSTTCCAGVQEPGGFGYATA